MKANRIALLVATAWVAAGAAGCVGFNWKTVQGSGQLRTETRPVSGFKALAFAGAGVMTIVQGETEELSIEADDNLLPLIRSEVTQQRLWIGTDRVNLRPSQPIRYTLKVKTLESIEISGSLHATAPALRTEQLDIAISGSGQVEIPQLQAETLSMHISGSGSLELSGEVQRQSLAISGSAQLRAINLASQIAALRISGSGEAEVWARETLETHISGSAEVRYRGQPRIEQHISGSGRLRPIEER